METGNLETGVRLGLAPYMFIKISTGLWLNWICYGLFYITICIFFKISKEPSDEVPTSTDPVSYTQQIDKESKLPEESICKTTADPSASENREDAVDQPKEEQDTKSVTDDLKVNRHLNFYIYTCIKNSE